MSSSLLYLLDFVLEGLLFLQQPYDPFELKDL
jgi:hypothetical protein